jgi:hypothetical protein
LKYNIGIVILEYLEYFTDICYNLWPFVIICDHLVYFSHFGMFGPRKIWQPWTAMVPSFLTWCPSCWMSRYYLCTKWRPSKVGRNGTLEIWIEAQQSTCEGKYLLLITESVASCDGFWFWSITWGKVINILLEALLWHWIYLVGSWQLALCM